METVDAVATYPDRASSRTTQAAELVAQLRDGPLASVLEIPETYQPENDAHLEQVAGQLLEHFRANDDVESYVALVELTQERLQQVAVGVTRRLALMIDPDDLVAAFMARLFTDVRRPRTGGPVRRFLALAYTMMRFDALNQLRLMRRSRERGIRFEEGEAVRRRPRDPVCVADARDRAPSLSRLGTLLLAVVGRCFHDLRTRDRRVLICREIEGLSYDEIASAMDLPRAQVGMVLKRARDRLAERIDRAIPDAIPEPIPAPPPAFPTMPPSLGHTDPGKGPRVAIQPPVRIRKTTTEFVR